MTALVLRPWRDNDAPALMAAAGDPALHRWTSLRVEHRDEATAWLTAQHDGWVTGNRYSFAIVDEQDTVLGHVALKSPGAPATEAEVGYWTAAHARGRGVAPRAVKIITGWAFTTFPHLRRLRLLHQVDNTASCRVAVKSGYAYEQTLAAEHPYPREGHLHVHPHPALLRRSGGAATGQPSPRRRRPRR
ncbi:GNAT family N-acetyltransferase [Actinoplanes sp. NPDC049548]|uniref:GNAT family N-acetyltransferase n=1 Tax=Actinoplanes sp. NPDC049548 TaxID=3155152 RepID=UPI0034421952